MSTTTTTETTETLPPVTEQDICFVAMPKDVWAYFQETLTEDSYSSAFDWDIRAELRRGLNMAWDVTDVVTPILDSYPRKGYGIGEEIEALTGEIGRIVQEANAYDDAHADDEDDQDDQDDEQ